MGKVPAKKQSKSFSGKENYYNYILKLYLFLLKILSGYF